MNICGSRYWEVSALKHSENWFNQIQFNFRAAVVRCQSPGSQTDIQVKPVEFVADPK